MVVGAGISGLATAALLAREGYIVTVLEKQPTVGGRAGSWESEGFRFDTGPSWFLMPEVFDHFFRLFGTSTAERLDLVKLDPGYRILFEGYRDPVDIVANRDENIKLFEEIESGAGRKLDRYLVSAADTYDIAIRRFLYSTFTSFRPLLTADVLKQSPKLLQLLLQSLHSYVARRFKDPRLRQILGYPAVFLGSSPFVTPSMYHLMSRLDLADGVYYPIGGFTTLIDAIEGLCMSEGVTVRTGMTVTAIHTQPGESTPSSKKRHRASVTGVDYFDEQGEHQSLQADVVVSAADLHHTETTLVDDSLQTYPHRYWRRRIPGPGGLLIYLGVRGSLPQLEHHTLLFSQDWRENFRKIFGRNSSVPEPASLYICRPSASDSTVAPAGHENIFVLVPIPADPSLGRGGTDGAGDEAIERLADTVIDQIANWAGIDDLADRIVIRRTVGPQDFVEDFNSWKGTMLGPAHTLKQSAFFRGSNASKKVSGLYYAGGSTLPGIGLPMCLISAELVLKHLRGDTSTGPTAEPAPTRTQG
ncbi:phytoene desaturase family protein [Arthrobacter roseus]